MNNYVPDSGRQAGKTTRMMEEAVNLIAEGHDVYITGAHTPWLSQLERDFKDAGLEGVYFYAYPQVCAGWTRGARGRLLVDDPWDLPYKEQQVVLEAQRIMNSS